MMTDRWEDVERIVQAALVRAPHERAAFVANACAGDTALRADVESLLARDDAPDHLLNTPAAVLMAMSEDAGAFVGRHIGPYTVVGLLGVGGMGEVYRARDRQLDRDVAIKMLPPPFINDSDRLARFQREAKILAALNHPQIGAIYGLEQVDGVPALVLELVEGPTLADRLSRGALRIEDALLIASQIAVALEAAHSQGIVHRDLKPANVKVTGAGLVKLLDFGLAKGVGPDDTAAPSSAVTTPITTSRPGAILGTAAYMSPEQARGEPVDARSDLFSLGAVLYEMVTGRPPFSGETLPAILRSILNDTPSPPRTANPHVPAALEQTVMRLLAKDRSARYQQASEVRNDLQRLARDLESYAHPWRRRSRLLGGVTAAMLLAAIAIWTMRQPPADAPIRREYTQITHFADSATSPALSPDGRQLTFIRGASTFNGRGEIYVKTLPDGEPLPLTSDGLAKMSPVFSSDGATIAYSVISSAFTWDTWRVRTREGKAHPWLKNASGLSWLRDRRLIFSELTGAGLHMQVTSADEQQNTRRVVYSPGKQGMAHRSAVSPDGAWVLIAEMDVQAWQPCRLVPIDGSSVGRRIGPAGQCTSAAWSPDGQWMYFSANTETPGGFHLWRQRFPNGAPEQLTSGPTEEEGVAPDPDGRSVLTSVGTRNQSLWVHDQRGDREISREGYAFVPGPPNSGTVQPLPGDGGSVFYLVRQGPVRFVGARGERAGELWATDLATGRHRSILPGRQVTGYDVSRDGRQIAFAAPDERGTSHVWLAPLDRPGMARQLATFEADSPRFDAGGDILCRGTEDGSRFIYRLREGRAPEKALQSPIVFFHAPSPDGAWVVAMVQPADRREGNIATIAFPTSGGEPVRLCDSCIVDWAPGGRSLVLRFTAASPVGQGRTFMVTLEPGMMLPRWPAEGLRSREDINTLGIVREIQGSSYPSGTGSTYVVERSTTQRNIHRVPLP
jgi:serine/threonine protein kinase